MGSEGRSFLLLCSSACCPAPHGQCWPSPASWYPYSISAVIMLPLPLMVVLFSPIMAAFLLCVMVPAHFIHQLPAILPLPIGLCFHPMSSCSQQWLGVVAMWSPSLSFLFPVVTVVIVVTCYLIVVLSESKNQIKTLVS
jgi:hypothetical protein